MYQHHHQLCTLFQTLTPGIIQGLFLTSVSNITFISYFVAIILFIGPFVPYYVSVAALTSKGKGEFKAKVAFTLQGSMSEKLVVQYWFSNIFFCFPSSTS